MFSKLIFYILLLFFMFNSLCLSENLFKGEGTIILPPPKYKGSGIYETNVLISLHPIDEKNFLILWKLYKEKEKGIIDKEKIMREAKENKGLIKSVNPYEIIETSTYLSIMNNKGKTILESPLKEAKLFSGKSFPLFIDQSEKCPYAVLSNENLLCYGLLLEEKKSYPINIDLIDDVKVTYDGKNHTIWMFGKIFNEKVEFKNKEDFDFRAPLKPLKLGKRFLLEKEKEEELPFNFDELFDSISKIARSPGGEKTKLNPSFINLKVFQDLESNPGFFLLVEASETNNVKNISEFKGTTYFFKVYVDDYGIGKIHQLPFWVLRDNINEVYYDKEKSILYVPELARNERNSKAFSLGKNEILCYLEFAVAFPDTEGNYTTERGLDIISYYLYFPSDKSAPEIFNFYDDIWPQIEEDLSKGDSYVIPMFGLYSRIDKYNFLFKGICKEKDEKKDCFIISSIQK